MNDTNYVAALSSQGRLVMGSEYCPEPEPIVTQDDDPKTTGGEQADIMAEGDAAGGNGAGGDDSDSSYERFERVFPTFYGAEVTRGFRPALERAIAEQRLNRETKG